MGSCWTGSGSRTSSRGDGQAPAYRPRHPETTVLYKALEQDFEAYEWAHAERYEQRSGPLRPVVRRSVFAYLDCKRYGQPTLWARLRDAGMLTTPEVAVALGVGIKTVANWAKAGRLRGKRCGRSPRARWLFEPFAEQTESIRQRVAARARLKKRRGVLSDAAAGQGAI